GEAVAGTATTGAERADAGAGTACWPVSSAVTGAAPMLSSFAAVPLLGPAEAGTSPLCSIWPSAESDAVDAAERAGRRPFEAGPRLFALFLCIHTPTPTPNRRSRPGQCTRQHR